VTEELYLPRTQNIGQEKKWAAQNLESRLDLFFSEGGKNGRNGRGRQAKELEPTRSKSLKKEEYLACVGV